MIATVYRSTGSWYDITDEAGQPWKARIKGVFKIDGLTSTNPIAVGDTVDFEIENETDHIATIYGIHDRHNYISRQSPGHRKQQHIVASNLDQAILVATISHPRTSAGFIDRFLVATEAYHVPALLVINKMDTWKEKEKLQFAYWKEMYEAVGYTVMPISVQTGEGLDAVKAMLQNKTSLFSGHSGVGKSSLLNALVPGFSLRTKEVSGWSGKGMHTTTFAEMFDLPFGGKVVDTPGIREFGIVDIEREELSHYFPEMRQIIHDCQFNNCQHMNEPGCAVKKAVEEGRISPDRLGSYWNILESMPQNNWE
ncbi:MAG TPA: ribosome small subunit-dependent GTPase A [Phnomibacter sp.]|nr:ribosome small subunit-dependent GTPase A [Phnomibacter sp.]